MGCGSSRSGTLTAAGAAPSTDDDSFSRKDKPLDAALKPVQKEPGAQSVPITSSTHDPDSTSRQEPLVSPIPYASEHSHTATSEAAPLHNDIQNCTTHAPTLLTFGGLSAPMTNGDQPGPDPTFTASHAPEAAPSNSNKPADIIATSCLAADDHPIDPTCAALHHKGLPQMEAHPATSSPPTAPYTSTTAQHPHPENVTTVSSSSSAPDVDDSACAAATDAALSPGADDAPIAPKPDPEHGHDATDVAADDEAGLYYYEGEVHQHDDHGEPIAHMQATLRVDKSAASITVVDPHIVLHEEAETGAQDAPRVPLEHVRAMLHAGVEFCWDSERTCVVDFDGRWEGTLTSLDAPIQLTGIAGGACEGLRVMLRRQPFLYHIAIGGHTQEAEAFCQHTQRGLLALCKSGRQLRVWHSTREDTAFRGRHITRAASYLLLLTPRVWDSPCVTSDLRLAQHNNMNVLIFYRPHDDCHVPQKPTPHSPAPLPGIPPVDLANVIAGAPADSREVFESVEAMPLRPYGFMEGACFRRLALMAGCGLLLVPLVEFPVDVQRS